MFQEQIEIELSLTIGSDVFTVPGGAVKQFDVEAQSFGFEASLTFCISSELEPDEVHPRFVTDDLLKVTLAINSCVYDVGGPKAVPLKLIGYAFEKSLVETVGEGLAGAPVLVRRYGVRFRDAASLFWKQHFPVELHVDTSMSKLIGMHKVEGIATSFKGGPFEQKHKMLSIPHSERSSFYDFVCWYLSENSCVMQLDAASSSYTFGKTKSNGASVELEPEDVAQLDVLLPDPRRHELHVLSSFTEGKKNQKVAVTTSVTGLRHDVLYTTPIAKSFEARVARESEHLRPARDGLHLTLARFPIVELRTGTVVKLGEGFSRNMHAAKASYRVIRLSVHARAAGESEGWNIGLEDAVGTFDVQYDAELEHKSDPTPRLPAFTPPSYPTHVEAKIVSFGGGDKDRTWFSIEDQASSMLSYQVDVPLFNKKIEAPFGPSLMSGHFFFPAYKHARVLVALRFDSAEIVRHLDWADNARLPKETQGNQIVFGYQKNNGTALQHVYKDGKPEMVLKRNFGNDVQTLEIAEGLMRWTVEEVQGVAELEPTYDVTVQVEGAKGQLSTKVGAAVTELGGKLQGSTSQVVTSIGGATDEVSTAVAGMEAKLVTSIETVKSEIRALADTLSESFEKAQAAVVSAKDAVLEEAMR